MIKLAQVINSGNALVGQLAMSMGYKLEAPLFIIGTGRCGSSLLVKILNAHPKLNGFPTEANELWHPYAYPYATKTIETPPIVENPKLFTENSLNYWPNNHEKRINQTFVGYHLRKGFQNRFFVKSAMISFMVPTLLSLYPDAKFIHIYRNGPSVVESFLKKEWAKYRAYFSSQDEYRNYCAHYWNACLLEIESQRTALSLEERDIFLEFSYEQLCNAPVEILGEIGRFLSIRENDFVFDTSKIVSQNYKVGDYLGDEKWSKLLQIMSPAMKLKGYLP